MSSRPLVQVLVRSAFGCAFALSLFSLLSPAPRLASADEPSLADWTQQRVEDGLLKPLAAKETHTFSRSRPPPRERRVRVLQTTATFDARHRPFMSFAVDVRFGSEWHENDIVGCAYAGNGHLFVKRGDGYRPASFLLGKSEDPVPGVCEAGPPAPSG